MYKVWVKVYGESQYATNSIVFRLKSDALEYGINLSGRWTAVADWEVREATVDEVKIARQINCIEPREA